MKVRILALALAIGLFQNCFLPPSDVESSSGSGGIVTWFFIWGTVNNANNFRAGNTFDSSCVYSNVVLPSTSCENSEVLGHNACKIDSISKGTIKYYRYFAEANENLSMTVNPSDPSRFMNCIAAYKENKIVSTNSPISDLETNQSLSSCQTSTSVSMTANSYRCISIHSLCDSSNFA